MLLKEEDIMATSTFDRELRIEDEASLERLIRVMDSEPSGEPIRRSLEMENDRRRCEELLKQLPLH